MNVPKWMETNFGLRAAQALYAIAICFLIVSIISTAIALGRLIYTTWDYSMKYGLNNLITLESAWNETLQFKTSNSWKQISSNSNDSSAEITYDNGGSTISIELRNPTYHSFPQDYDKWEESKRKVFSARANQHPETTYVDQTLEETGFRYINGNIVKLYTETVIEEIPNSIYQQRKEMNPEADNLSKSTMYYAVLIDNGHNIQIESGSESLLNDFLNTLIIEQ